MTCVALYVLLHLMPPVGAGEEARLRALLWQARNDAEAGWRAARQAEQTTAITVFCALVITVGAVVVVTR